jgi:hypothetical protein
MHSSPDGALRSVAAMAAGPYVEYYEHTHDNAFLRAEAYPIVREVSLFYASYLKMNPTTGKYEVPHACAQECATLLSHFSPSLPDKYSDASMNFLPKHGSLSVQSGRRFCGERQLPPVPIPGPPGSHGCPQPPQKTPTIDLAFAEYMFQKAVEWSELLDVDAQRRVKWQGISAKLSPYPLAQHHDCAKLFPWAAATNCTGWSEATNTDTNTSAELHANFMWPIANLAPIHPTGRVSLSSDNATKLLARNTAWMLGMDSSWAPVRRLCSC